MLERQILPGRRGGVDRGVAPGRDRANLRAATAGAVVFDHARRPSRACPGWSAVTKTGEISNVTGEENCSATHNTTVQPKAAAFPTDAKLMHRTRERLVTLAAKTGVSLRQSYAVGKHALIAHQRYTHAKQFKRANRALKTIRTYLGRVIRDIVRKIKGEAELESAFAHPLMLAHRVREQRQHQRGRKSLPSGSVPRVYSLHAPEVECIGKGKAHRPYEFGVKVSLARHHAPSLQGRPVHRPRQG